MSKLLGVVVPQDIVSETDATACRNTDTNFELPLRQQITHPTTVYGLIDYPDAYVQPLVLRALDKLSKIDVRLVTTMDQLPSPSSRVLQIIAYEKLDFEHAMDQPTTSLIGSYTIRKALIRKHYLSTTVSTWLVKRPNSVLSTRFKPGVHFELDFAEFLDEALVDAWDLNDSMARNDAAIGDSSPEWWILKPGMSDGGNGLRLFSTLAELQAIFEEWEGEESFEDDKEEDENESGPDASIAEGDEGAAMTSQLRHFIAQPYIPDPLLFSTHGHRKFHIRTYVVAVGALKVYVYREMLALFAAKPYTAPSGDAQALDLSGHLTNTCFQDESTKDSSVYRFWGLQTDRADDWQQKVFAAICETTGEVFEAAAREQMIHFQTIPNAFEIFGVDFLVDRELNVWLLELNAFPDFKQTGEYLQDTVVGGLFDEVARVAIGPFFDAGYADLRRGTGNLPLVRELDLGRG